MYLNIVRDEMDLLELLFLLKQSSIYDDELETTRDMHLWASRIADRIVENDKIGLMGDISYHITRLSIAAANMPWNNSDIVTLIRLLSEYLESMKFSDSLEYLFSGSNYIQIKRFSGADYVTDEECEAMEKLAEQLEAEKQSSTNDDVGKDFFEDDFDFGDNEEPPEIYERPSEVDEADIIRKPKATD